MNEVKGLIVACSDCRKPLTAEEVEYYGHTCNSCESLAHEQLEKEGTMTENRYFYIRGESNSSHAVATGIQIVIPDGMSFDQAKTYAIGRITRELERYFIHECLTGIGMKP